ncbi:NAD(P)-dependent oxidoreductase [Alkalihalobacillus sp. MEB130]|uniref:NAD-dependent epimerase/dehydratase family protein n=1 Tax=Alkalihalobacillus sp. MEB130 TaxID=2976704 RepID=UPI0028DEB746|nr:NAD(P)-dependent oxidoreductase [Alkalihalobacillus sp. MEB130]MDT8859798.1 NAD(P)-dependent oxidoreductase [Alkalihalobacillus sp. MEB130]
MKKIVIIGGAGTVGKQLVNGLRKHHHEITVIDQHNIFQSKTEIDFIQADATNLQELMEKVPKADVLINLLNTETKHALEDVDTFEKMTSIFFKSTYYLLYTANQKNIQKVIFASTNHVTDCYEDEGKSILGREITVKDYPCSNSLYGVLKFASEQVGALFSKEERLSVINIRIGSVPKDVTKEEIEKNDRLKHTLLTDTDLIALFQAAIESDVIFGTYYGVSDNIGKPWDMENAKKELGYKSEENTSDIL